MTHYDVFITNDSDRSNGCRKVLERISLPQMSGKRVLIKPNLNTDDEPPGSTHIDTLRTVLEAVMKEGPEEVVVGDRSGPMDTRQVFESKGVFKLGDEMGARCLVFDEMDDSMYQHFGHPGMHWRDGFWFARPVLEADVVISLCCLKTHQYGGHFTMSLKNTTGMVHRKNMSELHSSQYQREMIAEMNLAYEPHLIVMDGVEAFFEGGPMTGSRWKANVTLASTDRVAIDATGVAALKMHGTTPPIEAKAVFEQDQIRRAVELGLGASGPHEVHLVSVDEPSFEMVEDIGKVLKGVVDPEHDAAHGPDRFRS